MSEGISDFAGAGANVVAKGVSITQYRDDKSRRRIEAYDTFEENAKKYCYFSSGQCFLIHSVSIRLIGTPLRTLSILNRLWMSDSMVNVA